MINRIIPATLISALIIAAGPVLGRPGGRPPTSDVDEQTFEQTYHYPLTHDGLLSALRDPHPDVRSFAALKLAALGQKDTVPAILAALSREPMDSCRVSLALAAGRLDSKEGTDALSNMCRSPHAAPVIRLISARTLTDLGSDDCLGSVLDIVRAENDEQVIVQALYALTGFKQVPEDKLQDLLSLVYVHLAKGSTPVRLAAGYILREIGNASSTEILRKAAVAEEDATVRRALNEDVDALTRRVGMQGK